MIREQFLPQYGSAKVLGRLSDNLSRKKVKENTWDVILKGLWKRVR